jgi:hypothetical protein
MWHFRQWEWRTPNGVLIFFFKMIKNNKKENATVSGAFSTRH